MIFSNSQGVVDGASVLMVRAWFLGALGRLVLLMAVLHGPQWAWAEDGASVYGRDLLQRSEIPAEMLTRYENAAVKKQSTGGGDVFFEVPEWVGTEFPAKSGMPYTLVVKVRGRAVADGEVQTRWQPMWNDKGPVLIALFKRGVKAGEPVVLEGGSAPVRLKVEGPTVPTLSFRAADNLHLDGVTVEVWSGIGKASAIESLFSWSTLLFGLVFMGLVVWWRKR